MSSCAASSWAASSWAGSSWAGSSWAASVRRPSRPSGHRSGIGPRAVLSMLLLGLLLTVLGATPAAAHDTIEGSNPADGATVATIPATVTLTFDEQPQDFQPVIQVTGPDGMDWADGTPTVSGTDVSVPVRAGAPAGAYTVAYRIVSSDGHPVTGQLSFTAEAGAAAAETTAATTPTPATSTFESAPTSSAVASSPTVSSPVSPTPISASVAPGPSAPASTGAVTPAASSDAGSGSGISWWVIVLIVLAVAAGGGAVAVLTRRARSNRTAG